MQPVSSSNSSDTNNNTINDALRQLGRDQIVKVFKNSTGNGIVQGQLPGDEGYGEIMYDSAGTPRLVLRVKNDVPELKISPSGVNVLTAANSQLNFNSSQNMFKIVLSGTTTITPAPAGFPASTTYTATIPHGLTYAPAFQVFGTVPNWGAGQIFEGQLVQIPIAIYQAFSPASIYLYVQAHADSTNLYIKLINPNATPYANLEDPWTFKYYIFQESAV